VLKTEGWEGEKSSDSYDDKTKTKLD